MRELLHVSVSVLYQAICGYGAQDALPFRSVKEGELFFVEDRDVNLVELALATNIPKGCAETMVRGTLRCYVPHAGSSCSVLYALSYPYSPDEFTNDVSCLPAVNVSYLDGKGNLEPQGTGETHTAGIT